MRVVKKTAKRAPTSIAHATNRYGGETSQKNGILGYKSTTNACAALFEEGGQNRQVGSARVYV